MSTVSSQIPKLGVRNTRQRTAVIQLMREIPNFMSAKSIYRELESRHAKVGLTTVYRTLQSMADIEEVDVLHMANGETLYRHCQQQRHHHHLVCIQCGHTREIIGGPVEPWARQVAEENDFELTGHDAEIFGICSECKALGDTGREPLQLG